MRCGAALLLLALAVCGSARAERPSGQLAYVRLTDGYWQLWLRDLDTARDAQLTQTKSDKRTPAWGSDDALYFRTSNGEIYRWRESGGGIEPVARDAWPAVDPAPSPQGSTIALAELRPGLRDASRIVLVAGGTSDRLLTPERGSRVHLAWSPDGTRLAYAALLQEGRSEIREVSVAGADVRRLGTGGPRALYPAYAPDGRQMAYASNASGDFEIWLAEEGRAPKALTDSPGLDSQPVWSPDGAQIAFTTRRRGMLEIWVMQADGTHPEPLITGAPVMEPAWR